MKKLNDIKIAILTENGFEQVELTRQKPHWKMQAPKWM